ncbi:MAG: sugar phosphate isomerase/epimerase [Candidatus Bathyarchaeia archaeon]|nr:sugar phosphate isomerase/epimerase [Candidatus Bathyarchaeota archaeon]
MAKPKIGAQLIIWGNRVKEDILGVLDEVSSIGYEGIEADTATFEKIKDPMGLLDAKGLSLAGLHTGLESIDEKSIEVALNLLQRLDGHYLIFSGAGGKENAEENYRRSSRVLEKIGKKAKAYGVKVCYHNHWQEIINDATGIRIICEETSPEYVSLCVDTYWVKCGGLSPVEFIKRHLDRVAYLHLKDGTDEGMKRYEFRELGHGDIDFPAIIDVAKKAEIEWYVVEQDRTNKTPKESMEISRKYLKALGI